MDPALTQVTSEQPAGPARPAGWFILFRLVMFCLVAGASLYKGQWGAGGQPLLWIYFAATLAFLLFYRRWRSSSWLRLARITGGLQLFLEVAVEGMLVAHSNGFASPFVLLFVLSIVSASLQFRLIGTLFVATACSLTVAVAVFLSIAAGDPLPEAAHAFRTVLDLNDDLFYALFLYVCAFYLAAFVSGYLAERLELKDRALEGASRALAQARLETDDILRHMQSGLLTVNGSGTLVFFNRTAEEILGFREHDITGRHCREVFDHDLKPLGDLLLSALQGRRTETRTELRVPTACGGTIPVGISTSLLGSTAEGIRGVIAVFQDLTLAKKLEERMRVADRLAAVGELSASIAHEIRNPLATVTGSIEMLRRDLELDSEGRSLMDLVLKESSRLNKIVADFLDFARIKQQACQAVDLKDLSGEVLALFEHHPARTPGSLLETDFPPERLLAAAAEPQLKQVLVNLVQNALEALPPGTGRVRLSGRRLETRDAAGAPMLELAVEDTGTGMSPAVLEKVGQPFFSTKKQGTGLGIAIVQRLVAAMGGNVVWRSTPGQGTTFVIRIPAFDVDRYRQEVSGLVPVRRRASAGISSD